MTSSGPRGAVLRVQVRIRPGMRGGGGHRRQPMCGACTELFLSRAQCLICSIAGWHATAAGRHCGASPIMSARAETLPDLAGHERHVVCVVGCGDAGAFRPRVLQPSPAARVHGAALVQSCAPRETCGNPCSYKNGSLTREWVRDGAGLTTWQAGSIAQSRP